MLLRMGELSSSMFLQMKKNISGVIFFEGRLTRKYIKNNEDKNSSTHNFSIVCSEKGGAYKIEKLLILKDL